MLVIRSRCNTSFNILARQSGLPVAPILWSIVFPGLSGSQAASENCIEHWPLTAGDVTTFHGNTAAVYPRTRKNSSCFPCFWCSLFLFSLSRRCASYCDLPISCDLFPSCLRPPIVSSAMHGRSGIAENYILYFFTCQQQHCFQVHYFCIVK